MQCSELILSLTTAEEWTVGAFLMVQWLGLHAFIAVGTGLIPGQGTNIPHAIQPKKKKERERERENFLNRIKKQYINLKLYGKSDKLKKKRTVALWYCSQYSELGAWQLALTPLFLIWSRASCWLLQPVWPPPWCKIQYWRLRWTLSRLAPMNPRAHRELRVPTAVS